MRFAIPPVVDGRLEDPCWITCEPIGPLVQMEPLIGVPATERTDVRLGYDEDHFYIGVRCFDSSPSEIVATQMTRDAELNPDDRIEIVIDTFHDRRNAFFFQMSPAGSKGDALIARNGGSFNKPWDGIWEGKATIDDLGWSMEIALPLKTLSFDPSNDTWGFNINRVIKRKLENSRWSGLSRDASFFHIHAAGDVSGLVRLQQGIGLDVVPFVSANWSSDRTSDDSTLLGSVGFDAFYRITPGFQAGFTVNTDFAETEVDDRRINLTRFPLFFPEKRAFFLQDAGIFEFSDLGSSLVPFFSRRIGLDKSGDEVPILVGAKLTGRVDDWSIGLLDVETKRTSSLPARNLSVARISRNIGEEWTVGGVFTNGDPSSDRTAQLYGVDAGYRTDSAFGDKNVNVNVWGLKTSNEEQHGDDAAFGTSVSFPNDLWSASASAREVQENFDPKLGFVPRRGVRQYSANVGVEPRIDSSIRRLEFELSADAVTGVDDRLQTLEADAQVLGVVWDSGDELKLQVKPTVERLDDPFEIEDGVTIPVDDYTFMRYRAEFESALKRPLSADLVFETGEFFDGRRDDYEIELAWRPSAHLSLSTAYERSDVDLPEGRFTTHVGRVRCDISFSPDVSWSNFVQFDNESDSLGLNSRLRWILKPGRDFFVVFNETLRRSGGSLAPTEQEFAFKLGYTLRF